MRIPFFSSKKDGLFKDLLSAAYNVYNYRRDVIAPEDASRLSELIEQVEELYDDSKTDSDEFKNAVDELKVLMKKCGGKIYPLSSISDNVDVVVVAGILAISVRSFFFQPFQIPTNSMYPTYFGMTAQVYNEKNPAPTGVQKIWNLLTKKASNYTLKAPSSGEVFIKLNNPNRLSNGLFANFMRPTRWLGVLPSSERVYTFYQNGKTFELALPDVFPIEEVMKKAFPLGVNKGTSSDYARAVFSNTSQKNGEYWFSLGNKKLGEDVLNFDILGGDMLFVDRFTYNFRKPKVGEPFVFRTAMCDGITRLNHGVPDDKYYIKRLVAESGDTLQIKDYTLFRNGKPSTGAEAFDLNANQVGEYCGYRADGDLADGKTYKVPQDSYYAMGDNSANSLDSRYWGAVPKEAVVGKPIVIFYPFTSRWGTTK